MMKPCPFCAESIQDQAIKCRYCGEYLAGHLAVISQNDVWCFDYRTETEFFGWPLIHIASGINRRTGLPKVAKGIIAIGNFAVGGIALGGIAVGGFTIAGIGLGVFVLAGIAFGIFAVGGIAVGILSAIGGLAISIGYASGDLALLLRRLLKDFL